MSTQTLTHKTYNSYIKTGLEWIDKIPSGWSLKPLKYFFYIQDTRLKHDPSVDTLLSVSGYDGIVPKNLDGYEGQMPSEDVSEYRIVRKNNLVVNTMWLNYAGLGVSDYEGYVSPAYRAYEIGTEIYPRYAHYLLRSQLYVQKYSSLLYGVRPNSLQVKPYDFDRIEVLIPTTDEQKAISNFLDTKLTLIDSSVAKKKRLIELLQEKRQALITKAVTKGLDPDAKMKDSGVEWIGMVPEKWNIRRLKNLFCSHASGTWGEEENGNEDDVICIRVADFDYDQLRISVGDKTLRNITKSDLYKKRLRKGDLLLEKSGGGEKTIVGRAVLFEFDYLAVCANFIEFHRFNNLINSKYGMYLFAALYHSGVIYKNIKQTTGIQNLDLTGLYSQLVVYPGVEEQNEIVDYLDTKTSELDKIRNLLQKQINRLQEFKSSLIYNAVTGKIKV